MQLNPDLNKQGMVNTIKQTFRERGLLGFYRGYGALLMFSIPKNQVRFGTYTFMQTNVLHEKSKLNNFICGLSAGAAEAVVVVTPQETLKTKLIHDKLSANPQYKNVFHGIKTIVNQQGLGGMYKGVVPTLLKQSTNQGVRFVVFEDTQKKLNQFLKYKMLVDFLSGGFAGFCSVMFNNPIDVIKTNMQSMDAAKYGGFFGVFNHILANEGPMGFYKGVGPRLARVILDVALTFTIYNQIKRLVMHFI
jgi:solute carrier family 25 citrate transporter 1